MKASELMIGDWVSVLAHFLETSTEGTATSGGYNLCRKNCRIGGMNGDLIAIDKICSYVIAYDPIPLTEEILKANGFTYKETMEEWWHESYVHEWGMAMSDFELSAELKFGRAKITYVHELQHALRLCGLTDLADNFKIKK